MGPKDEAPSQTLTMKLDKARALILGAQEAISPHSTQV